MTDPTEPVERVARVLQIAGDKKYSWRGMAEEVIRQFTQQGIPIERLLSGKMMAVQVEPTEDMIRGAVWFLDGRGEGQAMFDAARAWQGMVGVCAEARPHEEMVAIRKRLAAMRKQAQFDYAGGQIVTPEDYEDVRAPHKPGLVTVKKGPESL